MFTLDRSIQSDFENFREALSNGGLDKSRLERVIRNLSHFLLASVCGKFSESVVVLCLVKCGHELEAAHMNTAALSRGNVSHSRFYIWIGVINNNFPLLFQFLFTHVDTPLPRSKCVSVHVNVTMRFHYFMVKGCLPRRGKANKNYNFRLMMCQ